MKYAIRGFYEIINGARELFCHKGFHGTSMAEISKFTGISVGQIYRVFQSKDNIISTIVKNDTELFKSRILDIREMVDDGLIDMQKAFSLAVRQAMEVENATLALEIFSESARNEALMLNVSEALIDHRKAIRSLIIRNDPNLKFSDYAAIEEVIQALFLGYLITSSFSNIENQYKVEEISAKMILSIMNAPRS